MPVEVGIVVQCLYCGSYFLSVIGTVKTPAEYGGGRIAQLAHKRALMLLQRGNAAGASAVTTASVKAPSAKRRDSKKVRHRTGFRGLSRDQIEEKLNNRMRRRQQEDDISLFLVTGSVDKAGASGDEQGGSSTEAIALSSCAGLSVGGSGTSDGGISSSLRPAQQPFCSSEAMSRLLACPKCGCLASGMSFDDYARSRRETVLTHCVAVVFTSNLSKDSAHLAENVLSPLYVLQGSRNVMSAKCKAPKWTLRLGIGPPTLEFDKRSKSTLIYAPSLHRVRRNSYGGCVL